MSQGIDQAFERARRVQADYLFRRSKQDEAEEAKYREELKSIDAQLKKFKSKSEVRCPCVRVSIFSNALTLTLTLA